MKPYFRIVKQTCGAFTDFTFFCIGYFQTKLVKSRAYIYMTIFNVRFCIGVQWPKN